MKCILVFDHLNDVIYSKCDKKFVSHVKKLGWSQGGLDEEKADGSGDLNVNFIIQLFSPIVTSQRIMSSQFGNSYTSIQCQDGMNLVFDEYMGYLFVNLGFEDTHWLKRMLGICISIIQHLCGPDVSSLKTNISRNILVSRLLDTWSSLVTKDQAVLLEAIEQLTVNTDLSTAAIKALREATEKFKTVLDLPKSHALIFVENKFLALYSSKNARELSSGDLLFLSLLTEAVRTPDSSLNEQPTSGYDSNLSSDEFYSPPSSPEALRKHSAPPHSTNGELNKGGMFNEVILLSAGGNISVSPYVLHLSSLSDGVSLLLLYQTNFEALSFGLNDAFEAANAITCTSLELDGHKKSIDYLETSIKKVFDAVKKLKSLDMMPNVEACIKVLHAKWDILKKQWMESNSGSVNGRISSCVQSLIMCLKDLLQSTVLDVMPISKSVPLALLISQSVASTLAHVTDFLQVKALRNFTLGSRASLSINKYLEEFPGLVHFLYIDRVNHRITTPTLDFKSEETVTLTKKKVWSMVDFSRIHLQEGHLAIMWKDTTFNYAYYLWFEDTMGAPLKPKVSPSIVVKSLNIPGVFNKDFYLKMIEGCFPKTPVEKVRCYELYCVHLGLATSSCVLEHSRRLAATIWEVTGVPNNPLDLL